MGMGAEMGTITGMGIGIGGNGSRNRNGNGNGNGIESRKWNRRTAKIIPPA